MTQPTVFISYSSKDEKEKEILKSHLQILQEAQLAQIWSDDEIGPGTDWEQEMDQAMATASVAVLLVTANFISSKVIRDKIIPKLLERHRTENLVIVPVVARACAWKEIGWLNQMSVRPQNERSVWSDDGRHVDEDLADIVREIATTIKNIPISILRLLHAGLDTGPLAQNVQQLYDSAEKLRETNPNSAIDFCRRALTILERGPSGDISDLDALPYSRGKFHLLLGAVYRDNESQNLPQAEIHFYESGKQFGSRKWLHLEALAYLGLAITLRKSDKLDDASEAIKKAKSSATPGGMPDEVDNRALFALRAAIKNEEIRILGLVANSAQARSADSVPRVDHTETASASAADEPVGPAGAEIPTERIVPIFNITNGEGLVTAGEVTDPNLLSLDDFQSHAEAPPDQVEINLLKRPTAQYVDYLLEVAQDTPVSDDLNSGVWLPIQAVNDPKKLRDRTVAALVKENGDSSVSLKTFFEADDHYLLRTKGRDTPSIVLVSYKSDLSKIKDYYAIDQRRIVSKRVDEVQIIGAVYRNDRFSTETLKEIANRFLWQVPLVNNIAAGLSHPIAEDSIKRYVPFNADEPRDAPYFGFRVEGDSMKDAGISSGQIVLIRQQEIVDNRDIAAVVIETPDSKKPLSVLKQFHLDERANKRHWFLKSRHPLAPHLVVIPEGTDVKEIQAIYVKRYQSTQIKFYKKAILSIAGKFVAVIPELQKE